MGMIATLSTLIKGKVVVTTLLGTAFVGGTGAALAATPAGQSVVQNITNVHATVTPTHRPDDTDKDGRDGKATPMANEKDQDKDSNSCPGQPEAQQLASKFSLSTDSKSSSMKVICALHDGSFQGTVDGKSVTTNHALGYGEIGELLTNAQSLATKNNEKLTDSNVLTYVATALKNCGSTAVAACVNANQPGDDNSGNGSGNQSGGNSNGNGQDPNGGKPAATPDPHGQGRPTSTPTSR